MEKMATLLLQLAVVSQLYGAIFAENPTSKPLELLLDLLDYPGIVMDLSGAHSHVPGYVDRVYQAMDTLDRRNANSSQQTVWAIEPRSEFCSHYVCYHFELPSEVPESVVDRVELVYPVPGGPCRNVINIQTCTYHQTACVRRQVVSPRSLSLGDAVFSVLDITINMRKWLASYVARHVRNPVSVVVRATKYDLDCWRQSEPVNPVLVLYANVDDFRELEQALLNPTQLLWPRGRRSAQFTNADICTLVEWYVDFDEIGWRQVVQPHGYHGNVCKGKCNLGFLSPAVSMSNHALIKTLAHKSKGLEASDGLDVDCIPGQLHPLSIIVKVEPDAYVIKKIPNMRVVSCNCL